MITRTIARKYFGEDAPIGKTLLINTIAEIQAAPGVPREAIAPFFGVHPMRVMAVLKDIPSNSHISAEIYAPGIAAFSPIAFEDRVPSPFAVSDLTYVKLRPDASIDSVRGRLKAFAERRYPNRFMWFKLMPLTGLHFSALEYGSTGSPRHDPAAGRPRRGHGCGAVGALIVLIAAINFVTLMTARATRRAVEVGVRKAVGASRRDLIVQFMGEALIYVLIAMLLAIALAEVTLPHFKRLPWVARLTFQYFADPTLAAGNPAGATLLIAALAGLYPALLLSSFRPAATLKGGGDAVGGLHTRAAGGWSWSSSRSWIGLIVMTGTIYRQTNFALHGALRLDSAQVLLIPTGCRSAFAQELAREPGVKAISCASAAAIRARRIQDHGHAAGPQGDLVPAGTGRRRLLRAAWPQALGRPLLFPRTQGEDMALDRPGPPPAGVQPPIVVNETGARQLGFGNPADAVGKSFAWTRWSAAAAPGAMPPARASRVIGVVPDFTLGSVREPVQATVYFVEPNAAPLLVAKLDGAKMPETMDAIARIWKRTERGRPVNPCVRGPGRAGALSGCHHAGDRAGDLLRARHLHRLPRPVRAGRLHHRAAHQGNSGVRKAMGAETSDIVRLLLWQFTKPVLWANLIAWPLAFWAMDHWLRGFAYRVDLPLWLFLAAAGSGGADRLGHCLQLMPSSSRVPSRRARCAMIERIAARTSICVLCAATLATAPTSAQSAPPAATEAPSSPPGRGNDEIVVEGKARPPDRGEVAGTGTAAERRQSQI